ncbi:MFS-type transporter SLC18B1-like isoform X3 [Dermacentor albipictus]|uniref:MFS-type transporter SLC18B1-like isoform X3 n=1 Tax=Dermacentor albipictus TaxID=60249 RepID=UPI0038FD0BF4
MDSLLLHGNRSMSSQMHASTSTSPNDHGEREFDAASLSVTAMSGTGYDAACPSPAPPGSPGRDSLDLEQGIETASNTLLRFLYVTSFLQGVSCGILEPFCQNELAPRKVFGALACSGLHGCYILGTLLLTPWTAKLMLKDIKMRTLFSWGLFIEGACCFSYEVLKPFKHSFVTGFIRVIQGVGASLVFPGYFFVICVQFPEDIPTLIPKFGAVFSLGMVLWSYSSGFLFGANVLMFPFVCVGCLLLICSFWAPFMLPQYRQKHGGFKIGIGSFLADESVLVDLAIMANAFLLFVSNRLSLADVLLKFGPINAHSHTLMAFSSPLYILAASMWARMRMTKFRIRLMSLLGAGVSLAGLSIAASLDKLSDDQRQHTCAIVASQVFIIGGCGVSFVSAFVHCYLQDTREIGARYSHIVLSGVTCTAISFGNFAGILFHTYIMDGLPYVQGIYSMLQTQLVIFILLCTTAVFCRIQPRDVGRLGYVNPDGSLRL